MFRKKLTEKNVPLQPGRGPLLALAMSFLDYSAMVIMLIGAVVIEIAAPLALQLFSFLRFIYLDVGGAQLECLLPQGQSALPYLFVGVAVGAPMLIVLVLTCLRAGRSAITAFCMFFTSLVTLGCRTTAAVAAGDPLCQSGQNCPKRCRLVKNGPR